MDIGRSWAQVLGSRLKSKVRGPAPWDDAAAGQLSCGWLAGWLAGWLRDLAQAGRRCAGQGVSWESGSPYRPPTPPAPNPLLAGAAPHAAAGGGVGRRRGGGVQRPHRRGLLCCRDRAAAAAAHQAQRRLVWHSSTGRAKRPDCGNGATGGRAGGGGGVGGAWQLAGLPRPRVQVRGWGRRPRVGIPSQGPPCAAEVQEPWEEECRVARQVEHEGTKQARRSQRAAGIPAGGGGGLRSSDAGAAGLGWRAVRQGCSATPGPCWLHAGWSRCMSCPFTLRLARCAAPSPPPSPTPPASPPRWAGGWQPGLAGVVASSTCLLSLQPALRPERGSGTLAGPSSWARAGAISAACLLQLPPPRLSLGRRARCASSTSAQGLHIKSRKGRYFPDALCPPRSLALTL